MSITYKLPEAPAGYKWRTVIWGTGTGTGPTVYVTFEEERSYPQVPDGTVLPPVASVSPDEEEIIKVAPALVEELIARITRSQEESRKKQELQVQYAHLLTD